jgi:hypothetical protein
MSTTPVLGRSGLAASQSQPHILINEAFRSIEAVTQPIVTFFDRFR